MAVGKRAREECTHAGCLNVISNRSCDLAFYLLAWKFVKRVGKEEIRGGFRYAISDESYNNPLLYLSFKIQERRKGIYLKGKDMCCDRSNTRDVFFYVNSVV